MTTLDRNHYQHQTSPSKLRGQYYTPDELVALMLDGIHLAPPHIVIDPACGDGSFLRGVVAAVARKFRGADRQALARHWADRLLGFDVDASIVIEARANLQSAFRQYLGAEVPEESLRIRQADVFRHPRLST